MVLGIYARSVAAMSSVRMKIIFGCSGRGAKGVTGAHDVTLIRKTKASNIFVTFIYGFLYVFSSCPIFY